MDGIEYRREWVEAVGAKPGQVRGGPLRKALNSDAKPTSTPP